MGTQAADLTVAVQDYLKAIYALEAAGERVTTSAIAARMAVSAPSATAMTKRLAELGLVERAPYKGVALTDEGRQGALEVLRHHRLLERYLADRLGLTLDEVHAEADRLEHALSEELEAKIDAELGFPTHDPHGDPIPTREGEIVHTDDEPLSDVGVRRTVIVQRVADYDPELLHYLEDLGLMPKARVEVRLKAPFNGPITVRIDDQEQVIGHEVARHVFVTPAE